MDYVKAYLALVNGFKLTTIFGLITLDFVLGVVVAIFSQTFQWSKLASFLDTSVLSLVTGYLLVGVFAVIEPQYSASVWATWAIIEAKLVADCINKIKTLGGIIQKQPEAK